MLLFSGQSTFSFRPLSPPPSFSCVEPGCGIQYQEKTLVLFKFSTPPVYSAPELKNTNHVVKKKFPKATVPCSIPVHATPQVQVRDSFPFRSYLVGRTSTPSAAPNDHCHVVSCTKKITKTSRWCQDKPAHCSWTCRVVVVAIDELAANHSSVAMQPR